MFTDDVNPLRGDSQFYQSLLLGGQILFISGTTGITNPYFSHNMYV